MARRAEGWRLLLDERTGIYQVRFRHAGRRRKVSTGERDPAEAALTAARIYAEAVSGRRVVVPTSRRFDELAAEWLEHVEPTLDPLTHKQYELYVGTHLDPWFEWTERLTAVTVADYTAHRLRLVARTTVQRELGVLRRICAYGAERGWLEAAPDVAPIPRTVRGTAQVVREHRALSPEQVEAILVALPEWTIGSGRGHPFRVRARWVVAWETGLRPATLDAIRAPDDYRRGAAELVIRDEVDKARFGRALPLTDRARAALDQACPDVGVIFGRHDHRQYLEAAGLSTGMGHVAPYDFRHSRLTYWASVSPDLPGIGFLAGHKHASTTAIYVHQARRNAESVLSAGELGSHAGHTRRGAKRGQAS